MEHMYPTQSATSIDKRTKHGHNTDERLNGANERESERLNELGE